MADVMMRLRSRGEADTSSQSQARNPRGLTNHGTGLFDRGQGVENCTAFISYDENQMHLQSTGESRYINYLQYTTPTLKAYLFLNRLVVNLAMTDLTTFTGNCPTQPVFIFFMTGVSEPWQGWSQQN